MKIDFKAVIFGLNIGGMLNINTKFLLNVHHYADEVLPKSKIWVGLRQHNGGRRTSPTRNN